MKIARYRYGSGMSASYRRQVELTVEGEPHNEVTLCEAPDEERAFAKQRAVEAAVRAFLGDPKAPPVVDATCGAGAFSTLDRIAATLFALLLVIIGLMVASVPRRVEVTFNADSRQIRYLVRRIALPRGVRDVSFDDVEEVELAPGRTGRVRALALIMKNGEQWGLASAAVGAPMDSDLDFCKVRIDEFLRAATSSG